MAGRLWAGQLVRTRGQESVAARSHHGILLVGPSRVPAGCRQPSPLRAGLARARSRPAVPTAPRSYTWTHRPVCSSTATVPGTLGRMLAACRVGCERITSRSVQVCAGQKLHVARGPANARMCTGCTCVSVTGRVAVRYWGCSTVPDAVHCRLLWCLMHDVSPWRADGRSTLDTDRLSITVSDDVDRNSECEDPDGDP